MTFLNLTIVLALMATVGALAWGVGSMAVGGAYDEKHSEKLMFTRVGIQVFAFVLLLVAMYLALA